MTKETGYAGAELGPIRPPSESESLLLRVTRNCPWNRCVFCGLYKKEKFSIRDKEQVLQDIAWAARAVSAFREAEDLGEPERVRRLSSVRQEMDEAGAGMLYPLVRRWYTHGMVSVFLQDANSLVYPHGDLREILLRLREAFPEVRRITSYARSQTLSVKTPEVLASLREAGLDRLHVGMESGSDKVLALVCKGATKEMHVAAGLKAKEAGFELSEYIMPGLGGKDLSQEHASESADALNQIDPDFIRLRSLAIPGTIPLAGMVGEGKFHPVNDLEAAMEIKTFLEGLEGIRSTLLSDHILNLLPDVEGRFPEDKPKMIAEVDWFLRLSPEMQSIYRIGRRAGLLAGREDLDRPGNLENIRGIMARHRIHSGNIDEVTWDLMKTFI